MPQSVQRQSFQELGYIARGSQPPTHIHDGSPYQDIRADRQIIMQQRMITALAYRSALENLSEETEVLNLTNKWHNFLSRMFNAVRDNNTPAENPFDDLLDEEQEDKKHSLEYLQQMAR